MNDLRHPCERWAEPISLAAAGCLSADEECEVRLHMEACADCSERFRQLRQLCETLAEAQLPTGSPATAIVERAMSAVVSDGQRRLTAGARAEVIHPSLLARSLKNWRWIMRSRVSRVAAAVVLAVAIGGVTLWFHAGGSTPAFADFIAPILEAKTARFKLTAEVKGPPATTITSEVMVLDAARSRQETEMTAQGTTNEEKLNKAKWVMITDWGRGKGISFDTGTKRAMVITLAHQSKEQIGQQDIFGWFRSVLLDARDKPDVKREPLGEKEIDGRRAIGFRVSNSGIVITLWGDPKTGLPVRAEMTMAMFPNVKTTMSNFEFNVRLDESLFSVEPPPGYALQNITVEASD